MSLNDFFFNADLNVWDSCMAVEVELFLSLCD